MKKSEIKEGETYIAKVSDKLVPVLVEKIEERRAHGGYDYSGRPRPYKKRTVYHVKNLKTGRHLSFRSAAKFRKVV